MSLGLKAIESKNSILSVSQYDDIEDENFKALALKNKEMWLTLYEEYKTINNIDRKQYIKENPKEYNRIIKTIKNLCNRLNDLYMEIWTAGNKIKNGESIGSENKYSIKSESIAEIRKKVLKFKKLYNLETYKTPYHMNKKELTEWLNVANKFIKNEDLEEKEKNLLISPKKNKQKKDKTINNNQNKKRREKGIYKATEKYNILF